MKTLFAAAFALVLAASAASAQQWTSQQMGPYRIYNGTDSAGNPWSGTSQRMGPYTHSTITDSYGTMRNCTSQRMGPQVITNCY